MGDTTIRQNFFEILGLANIERIHSQVLSWMFVSEVLSSEQKSEVLKALFGSTKTYRRFICFTEFRNIDVLIKADQDLFVIENKITSWEHTDQLRRYREIIDNADPQSHLGKADHRYFLYLSLIPEEAEGWMTQTYQSLHSALANLTFRQPNNFDQYAFNEYVESLFHLVRAFEHFNQNHTKFLNVFTEGHRTKHDKLQSITPYTDEQKYVAQNQLETIFQRHFLFGIAKSLSVKEFTISESHGTAYLQIKVQSTVVNGKEFVWGIQFQGTTTKINFAAKDYEHSVVSEIPESVMPKLKQLSKSKGFRLNRGREKAYISISKTMGKDIWAKSTRILVDIYRSHYTECRALIMQYLVESTSPESIV